MEESLKYIWKIKLQHTYSALFKMIRDILAISGNDAGVEQFFNQDQDITYYHQDYLHVKIIKTLIMLQMHNFGSEELSHEIIT